jgi:hypothetical protein
MFVIPASRGEYNRWNNFLDVLPYRQGLGPLLTRRWNLDAQDPDSSNHIRELKDMKILKFSTASRR